MCRELCYATGSNCRFSPALRRPILLAFDDFLFSLRGRSFHDKVQPTFSVHVYNDVGPVEGLKLKIVVRGSRDAEVLAEAVTDGKGIAVFQLPKLLWGGGLFLMPEHTVAGSQWPALDVEPDATNSSIEVSWPSQVIGSTNMGGKILTDGILLSNAKLSLRTLVS